METLKSFITESEIESLVRAHVKLQLGCYFSKSQPCLSGVVTTSKLIEDYYWNSLSSFKEADHKQLIDDASRLFSAENRKLAVYLDPTCRPNDIATELESLGFECEREVWMSPKSLEPKTTKCVATVSCVTAADADDFLRVFSIGFGGAATDKDGYGDIPPAYLDALRDSLAGQTAPDVEHIHLIARIGTKPVGCGSLHIGGQYGGLYNVTTLPEFRKSGIGAAVSQEAFAIARNRDVRRVFFQTQPGGSVQKFYQTLGCDVIFEAAIFHQG